MAALADRWWVAREVELTTAAANRSRLDNHMLPMWGEWPIGRIEHLDVHRTADAGVTIARDQLESQVLPAVPRRYRAVVATAAGAGLRWGECAGLRRRNLNLLRRELQVVEVAVEVATGLLAGASRTHGALLSSDDFGSSVERTARLHPLWRMFGWWTDAVWKKVEEDGALRGG